MRRKLTDDLITLQQDTPVQPYSVVHRLKLAKAYKSLGYPDLAIGDAYKALLLIDEVVEEGEYHDEALEAAEADFLFERMASLAVHDDANNSLGEKQETTAWAQTKASRIAYDLIIGCLIDCGCLRSAFDHITRAMKAFPGDTIFETYNETLSKRVASVLGVQGDDDHGVDVEDYPDKGLVRREQYPWNDHEPNRFSDESLTFLNEELANIAPRLEVRIAELPLLTPSLASNESDKEIQYTKQLGLFSKEDVPPGDQILEEKSLLTAVARLHEAYCDACSVLLPNSLDTASADDTGAKIVACEDCDEVFFCSTDCHDLAQDSYHPSLCGVDMDQGRIPASEAADSLYSRLLVRALALAETQDVHPLELKEVRYIWGDYHGLDLDSIWTAESSGRPMDAFGAVPQTLPFSFKYNILFPQQILEKMDVNIFTQSHRYDTWVLNTLYAKFRGTASARQGLDGRPEVSAVHPMWCLANHSCDPNVSWDWRGTMRFWTREQLVDWHGRDAGKTPGIKKGEEVFGHYCDVRLPVTERREWAVGALGGDCMCERCIWEAEERCGEQ
ncbi:uncharacterized protein K460DRAFT_293666 [Cucurbitaria berberidis CBS 394.84]|uniref:SET domain-containing protein n=1 Tax=Cucurbitaria berberidis CBS 394.84 TaxID=1168544 RepID=A0A9P4L506_9PLEO|nr:uncharacterized protein K460DRAFT_293666 [Cucurbitaria berberidis CBS 394.84]KAF1841852.1 hypothetical protein K460DRAFT_293666 [Cucurbitaria berberidis CBS 394.84]